MSMEQQNAEMHDQEQPQEGGEEEVSFINGLTLSHHLKISIANLQQYVRAPNLNLCRWQ